MMKKAAALSRILQTAALLTGCALLFILPFGGLSAAAEGYWSTQLNDEGEPVMIYTYTDMEPITYLPVDPDETMLPAEEPRQASVDVALAAAPVTAEPVEAIPAKASNPLGSLIAVGVLSLAGLAAALYKVI